MNKNNEKTILDLCSGTGSWSLPYRNAGYNIIEIEIKNGDDVRLFKKPKNRVKGILAAPPCTHLAGSGARYWKEKGEKKLIEALSIVDACLRIVIVTKPKFWALENPVGRLVHYLGKPKMYFHPYEFGDPWTKKTCLWGEFNIPKKNPVEPEFVIASNKDRYSKIHWSTGGKSEKTKILRSKTPSSFAKAFFEANP